jgi:hypothetical protein
MVLYSTDHCALCERALELLLSMPESRGWSLEVVDVADSETLVGRYGMRLPVLAIGAVELDWPFDRSAVARALVRGSASPGAP